MSKIAKYSNSESRWLDAFVVERRTSPEKDIQSLIKWYLFPFVLSTRGVSNNPSKNAKNQSRGFSSEISRRGRRSKRYRSPIPYKPDTRHVTASIILAVRVLTRLSSPCSRTVQTKPAASFAYFGANLVANGVQI